MPFHEKSAWIMSFALIAGGLFYFLPVLSGWSGSGQLASPLMPHLVAYTVCIVVIAVVGHIVIVALAPKDADVPVDEREKLIFDRAGHYSSYVLGVGALLSLGLYLLSGNGDLLFYAVFASLIASQLAEYLLQIVFYRTSI